MGMSLLFLKKNCFCLFFEKNFSFQKNFFHGNHARNCCLRDGYEASRQQKNGCIRNFLQKIMHDIKKTVTFAARFLIIHKIELYTKLKFFGRRGHGNVSFFVLERPFFCGIPEKRCIFAAQNRKQHTCSTSERQQKTTAT
jgi:hypothetical protein